LIFILLILSSFIITYNILFIFLIFNLFFFNLYNLFNINLYLFKFFKKKILIN